MLLFQNKTIFYLTLLTKLIPEAEMVASNIGLPDYFA